MQHNTWTRTKPTITEDCLLLVQRRKYHTEHSVYRILYDDGDIIVLEQGQEWGLWQDLTAQQYLTLKLPV